LCSARGMARASVLRAVRKPQRKPSPTCSNGCEPRRKPRFRCARCLLDARPQSRVTGELEQEAVDALSSDPSGTGWSGWVREPRGDGTWPRHEHAVLPAVIVALCRRRRARAQLVGSPTRARSGTHRAQRREAVPRTAPRLPVRAAVQNPCSKAPFNFAKPAHSSVCAQSMPDREVLLPNKKPRICGVF
jgi:hypothetical protein